MAKKKQQPGIMFYWEMFDVMQALPDASLKPLLAAIREYSTQGTEPQMDGTLAVIWPLVRQRVRNDGERYEQICSQNRIKGLISTFRRNYAPTHGLDPEDPAALWSFLRAQGVEEESLAQWTGVNCCPPMEPATAATPETTPKTKPAQSTATGIWDGCITEEKKRRAIASLNSGEWPQTQEFSENTGSGDFITPWGA